MTDDFSIYSADAIDIGVSLFGARTCSKCHARLPANADYFHADRDDRDGITSHCRRCRAVTAAAGYMANPAWRERKRTRERERYATEPAFRLRKCEAMKTSRRRRAGRA